MACGADTLATTLIETLTGDVPYITPDVPLTSAEYNVPAPSQLTEAITKLTVPHLTTGEIGGDGAFDKLMGGLSSYLLSEYKANRITGAEYTKAFIALTELAMAQGSAYLIQTDKQYWDNQLIQQQAELVEIQVATARVKLETAKVEHVVTQMQALNLEAEYAVKKMQLSLTSSQFCTSEYELTNIMPRKLAMLNEQITGQTISNSTATYNLSTMLPSQHNLLLEQIEHQDLQNQTVNYNLHTMLPSQHNLLLEQIEGQDLQNQTAGFNLHTMLPSQHDMLLEQIVGQTLTNTGLGLRNDGQVIANDTAEYNLTTMLPSQHTMLLRQITGQETANSIATYNLTTMLPAQYALLVSQTAGQTGKNAIDTYTLDSMLPQQLALLVAQTSSQVKQTEIHEYTLTNMMPTQWALLKEQVESARAQTLDTRIDGTVIVGTLGAQKGLHKQQVASYIQDGKAKVAKMYNDLWVTMITMNEDVLADPNNPVPDELKSPRIAAVMANNRASSGIVV